MLFSLFPPRSLKVKMPTYPRLIPKETLWSVRISDLCPILSQRTGQAILKVRGGTFERGHRIPLSRFKRERVGGYVFPMMSGDSKACSGACFLSGN